MPLGVTLLFCHHILLFFFFKQSYTSLGYVKKYLNYFFHVLTHKEAPKLPFSCYLSNQSFFLSRQSIIPLSCISMQVNAAGDLCAICQEKMHAPILLRCKHIFCEDCVSEWSVWHTLSHFFFFFFNSNKCCSCHCF